MLNIRCCPPQAGPFKSHLPLHPGVAPIYGTIRAHLEKAGTPIGPNDLIIAAHALQQKLILVTRNEEEFKRVPGLKVENCFE